MATATLGPPGAGYYLTRDQSVSWESTPGTTPTVHVFHLHRRDGERLLAQAGGSTGLELVLDGTRRIQGLRLLREVGSPHPDIMAVEVADLRWAWSRVHVIGRYNMRRRSGDRRIIGGGTDILGNVLVADDIDYHPASLNPPFGQGASPHDAASMLRDVLDQINSDLPARWKFEYSIEAIQQAVRPENVEIDDPGHVGLRRALGQAPGATVKVTDDARVVVYSQVDGSEREQRDQAGPAVRGPSVSIVADHQLVAPRTVDVLFTRECELRFDFFGDVSKRTSSSSEPREFENVLPMPDPDNADIPPGTWLTFDRAFEVWGKPPKSPDLLSHSYLRKQYLNPQLLGAWIELADINAALEGSDDLWANRYAFVMAHYLRTFRVPRRWIDRILELRDTRVAILDTETGTRAPAQAWQDFAIRYNEKSYRTIIAGKKQVLLARNVLGYANDLGAGRISPAVVRIIDPDEGIIRVDIRTDPYGYGIDTIPSAIKNIPSAGIGNIEGRPRWFGEVRGPVTALEATELTDDHKMAVVLSAIPAYPLGLQQLQMVRVDPLDLGAEFPDLMKDVPSAPQGPAWTVRIPQALETARFAWQDTLAPAIEAAFGLRQRNPVSLNAELQGALINGKAMESIARTAAALVYAGFRNRYIGTHVEHLSRDAELTGAVGQLVHTVANGQVTTTTKYLNELPARDLLARLPESVASAVRRLVK